MSSQIEEEYNQIKYQPTQLEVQLIEAIQDSLQNHLDQNATFLAERLVYEHDTEEFRSILAECYLLENKPYKAYYILKDCSREYNKYQLAIAYFRSNKFKEAEQALVGSQASNQFLQQPTNVPNGSYGHYLLGQIYEQLHRIDEAKVQYYKALECNPTLWMAFERLSKIGESVQINKVFNDQKQKLYEQSRSQQCNIMRTITNLLNRSKNNNQKSGQKEPDDFENKKEETTSENISAKKQQPIKPFTGPQSHFEEQNNQMKFLQQASLKPRPAKHMVPTPGATFQNYQSLLSQPFPFQQAQNKNYSQKKSEIQKVNATALTNNLINLPQLLKLFAHPFYLWTNYSVETIPNFQKLPPQHYRSGWVLEKVARNYMDQVKYGEAERIWKEVRHIEPYRLEGMDYYSSCLWHLKKQVELTHLAHSCSLLSIMAPETWVSIGNCFSLIKEIDNSLKFFQRAIQLRPDYSYAQTLSGHEYSQNENFSMARKCYETAISLDHRQYNAQWGLGNMFYKTDKYDEAIRYFTQAMKINPNNPVLPTFLAMSYAAKGDHYEALKYFELSERLDPMNGLNKYQKANSLIKLDQFDQALQELQKLSSFIPKEAPIFILMGRIHKKLGNVQEAQKCFNIAMSIDTKDSAKIKGLVESLSNPNNEFNDDFDL